MKTTLMAAGLLAAFGRRRQPNAVTPVGCDNVPVRQQYSGSAHNRFTMKQLTQCRAAYRQQVFGLLAFLLLSGPGSQAQSDRQSVGKPALDVGIRLQKTVGLYVENGLTAQYSHPGLLRQRLGVGLSYITSRLGTALGTNAIKQDNLLLTASYYFRPKRVIRTVIRLNAGYFRADYGSDLFNDLPRTSPLLSPELGLVVCPRLPLKVGVAAGVNMLTGNGVSGPGTLYPVFVQTSITWNVLR